MKTAIPLLVGGRIDPQTVAQNVKRWRREHQLDAVKRQQPFHNPPRILKLSGNSVVIDIDPATGEAIGISGNPLL